MLLGGLLGTALMLGAGALAVSGAPPAGPASEATWPAGETASLNRIPGERNPGNASVACAVTPVGGDTERDRLAVGEQLRPPTTDATVACEEPVALLTGTPRAVAQYTRGPLVTVPLFVAALGVLLFVPRFTHYWASLGTPSWMRRMFRIPPPN